MVVSVGCMFFLQLITVVVVTVSALTGLEQKILVDSHNTLRRGESSSDMNLMTWDPTLAVIAQNWSDACNFVHGQGINSSTLNDLGIGQNIYAISSPIDLTGGVFEWFNEKSNFDYDSNSCNTGQVCGHYTQVVWAASNRLGCSYSVCPSLIPLNLKNAAFLVCNYSPAGNYAGEKPYLKGEPCTKCNSGQFYCSPDGLCDSSCKVQSSSCLCYAACQNCGTVTTDCRCQCGTGWTGVDCSASCVDTDSKCGTVPGWPRIWCTPDKQYVLNACPAMCNKCVAGTPSPCNATKVTSTTATQLPTTTSPRHSVATRQTFCLHLVTLMLVAIVGNTVTSTNVKTAMLWV